jgi:hypothetical protein
LLGHQTDCANTPLATYTHDAYGATAYMTPGRNST